PALKLRKPTFAVPALTTDPASSHPLANQYPTLSQRTPDLEPTLWKREGETIVRMETGPTTHQANENVISIVPRDVITAKF
ncbi:hypothetical protein V5O48_017966, partial [Marasmius crinis-equi]